MANRFWFGSVHLDVSAGADRTPGVPSDDAPFRILVLGDFSGRSARKIREPLSGRKPMLIDRDNYDEVLARVKPELWLSAGQGDPFALRLRFSELDDFHPDRIFETLDLFQALRQTRERLSDPGTFKQTATDLQSWTASPPRTEPAPRPEELISGGSLLDQMIEDSGAATAPARRPADELQAFIQRIVAPHLTPRPDPKQAELVSEVDSSIAAQMSAILHHHAFQSLEAAWRGVFMLVRGLDTNSLLKLYILDVSKEELAADLLPSDRLDRTQVYRLLVEQGLPGADPWALSAGLYTFDGSERDAQLLGRMAPIARAAGAPFVAEAGEGLLGDESAALELWRTLRGLPEAQWIGLAMPRFLLRLPYGEDSSPTEEFRYEEMDEGAGHAAYLWGNPALICARLLGQSFSDSGWQFTPDRHREVSGLPLHVYKEQGESQVKPCAEVLMTESMAEAMLERGVMPLASLKEQDAVRLVRFQSIAEPPAHLAGRWG
ncbi:MAG: type VI secretion system contractile sheath domain-containing protein [Bryobacteraceae bacterium]